MAPDMAKGTDLGTSGSPTGNGGRTSFTQNDPEEGLKGPSVWHLVWTIPLLVAIIYGTWEFLEIYVITWVDPATLHYAYVIRGVTTAFVVTFVAVYVVLRDRKEHEARLEKTLRELKELDDMKNNFLSNVSHELRTPLTTINGYVKFMLSEKPGELNEKQEKYLKTMSEESDRLQHHIEELLFITTLESKPMHLNLRVVDLHNLAHRIVSNMKMKASSKDLRILRDVEEGLEMRADKDRLFQLLTNLVDNSIKYTPKGGRILLRITPSGKDINIQVIDSGIGIPRDKQEKVFERFYQVDSSISRKYGGTGLGLAICREIVRTSKGTIDILSPISEEDKERLDLEDRDFAGTMFTMRLPRDPEEVGGDA